MKQSLNLFSLLFIVASSVFSQEKVLDNAYLKCQYKHSYLKDTLDVATYDDLFILQIGKKISKFYSYYTFQSDSLHKTPDGDKVWKEMFARSLEDLKKHRDRKRWRNSFISAGSRTFVYKNYPQGKSSVTDFIFPDEYVIYEDELNNQGWQVKDSLKTILGYTCQQAVCNFRGRQWTAWFAPDVPISDGPWKFGGLPGLIMEVHDRGSQYHFTIIGLQKEENEPIIFSETYVGSKRFEKTNRIDFLKAQKNYLMDMNGYIQMETGIDLSGGQPAKIMRYDLMERDYR